MKKTILAFDTATNACCVALQVGQAQFARHEIAPQKHARLLLPMIQEVLNEAGIDLNALDAIAFGCGPGSFMGVRLAMATAQGLAFGLQIPLIPISSLRVIAQTAYQKTPQTKHVLAAWDARMDEMYWGLYAVDADGVMQSVMQDSLSKPAQLDVAPFSDIAFSLAGNAWAVYAAQLSSILSLASQTWPDTYPDARCLLTIANQQYQLGVLTSPENAQPQYVRHQVVQHHG